jgi:hypothetical protein
MLEALGSIPSTAENKSKWPWAKLLYLSSLNHSQFPPPPFMTRMIGGKAYKASGILRGR